MKFASCDVSVAFPSTGISLVALHAHRQQYKGEFALYNMLCYYSLHFWIAVSCLLGQNSPKVAYSSKQLSQSTSQQAAFGSASAVNIQPAENCSRNALQLRNKSVWNKSVHRQQV